MKEELLLDKAIILTQFAAEVSILSVFVRVESTAGVEVKVVN
jgi:hypothetical protein